MFIQRRDIQDLISLDKDTTSAVGLGGSLGQSVPPKISMGLDYCPVLL
jgi:hypothetical protein